MKKIFITFFMLALAVCANATNDVLKITSANVSNYALLTAVDSIYFSADGTTVYVQPADGTSAVSFACNDVSGISYISSDDMPAKLTVTFNGSSATAENPYFLGGVSLSISGAYVTVTNTNTTTEYTTSLSGSTSDGGFTYNGSYKTTIELNGLSLTSTKGAAIDIEDGKRVALNIIKNTVNTLTDCADGDQKACLYCKGHLEVDKAGTLNVYGNTKHAISAKEYIQLKKSSGTINILKSINDGIHCKQYFLGGGFTVNMSGIGDDGIAAELDGEENDEGYTDGSIIINDGTYNITSTVDGSITGTDTITVKGINAEGNVELYGGTITINMSGKGGKGIKVDGAYIQGLEDGSGPVLTVNTTGASLNGSSEEGGGGRPGGGNQQSSGSGSAKAIKAEGQVTIYGGTTVITTATDGAEGLESKTSIKICGGNHYLKTYDDCINSSGIIEFAGGNTVCYGFGNDAVDSNYGKSGAITISGGNLFTYSTKGAPEEGLDADNNSNITITGGICVSAGGQQGGSGGGGWGGGSSSTSSSVGSSSQPYYFGSSPSSYSTTYYYTLCNTEGEAVCTYKFDAGVTNSLGLLTAPNLGTGSITVKSGTAKPTSCTSEVCNASGDTVFFIAPTVTTTSTVATVTAN